ncbi:PH domain-containing protein [Paenibacillus fonticola]|uniref:PH domain-containing protein n=1 Tax=Paenibacillus fonticola TaxID=379896 RepID=UPI000377EA85|nr:PH domain-containing protein [Paenibacillus fonticola]
MRKAERYNPLVILFQLLKLVRNSVFFVVYLFLIKAGSESSFIVYGRYLFFVALGMSVSSIIAKWLTQKYRLDDRSFHLYKGVFNKSEWTVPFSKIQNINRHTSLFHRLFGVTSVRFETGMEGEGADVSFEVISRHEADRIEAAIAVSQSQALKEVSSAEPVGVGAEEIPSDETESTAQQRTVHFTPTQKDILKASFTSLSFLVLIPVIISVYSKINDVFNIEDKAGGFVQSIWSSKWLFAVIVAAFILASMLLGIARTFLKYGKYEISSDEDHIYIAKGVVDKTTFSIAKERVQAVELQQSVLKRWLGLAEVKLISAGGLKSDKNVGEINSLYPFLPVTRAYDMIAEILPSYELTAEMKRLPVSSLWIRLLRPSWLWVIITAGLYVFQPRFLAWWILSAVLLAIVLIARWLGYLNTRYILHRNFIQMKTGSFATTLFVSRRDKIIEVKVTQSKIQRLFGLATIGTVNRAKPVHRTGVKDVPLKEAQAFYNWYVGRTQEIEIE